MKDIITRLKSPDKRERGQILVILALAMVGLLVAAGLAVDGGVLFMRKAQLDRATDAAALAGVTKLAESDLISEANARGLQLMAANNIEIPESEASDCASVNWATDSYCGEKSLGNAPGSIRYGVQVEWEAETYFLPLVGFSRIPLRSQATAEYLPNVDLFATDTAAIGTIKASTSAIFGPDQCCHTKGDPYTPTTSPYWNDLRGVYTYRIRIPQSYYNNFDAVRVEIFDPDTGNNGTNTHVVYGLNGSTANTQTTCGSTRLNPCLLDTDTTVANQNQANPFWYVRVDEHREDDGNYTDTDNTATLYRLYYLEQNDDGSLTEVDLAYYVGKPDLVNFPSPTGAYTAAQAQTEAVATDMHWVAPGAPPSERMPAFTMQDVFSPLSPNPYAGDTSFMAYESAGEPPTYTENCEAYRAGHDGVADPVDGTIDADLRSLGIDFTDAPNCGTSNGDFIVGLKSSWWDGGDEVPNIYVDPTSGVRDLFLDVRGIWGRSENGYYFWVGPPRSADGSDDLYTVPSFINARQTYMLLRQANNDMVHSSEGAAAYGIGHLPMNSNITYRTELPLAYLGPEFAGQEITIGYFDPDSGASGPIGFSFDTIPKGDWMACFDDAGGSECNLVGGNAAHYVGPDGIPDGGGSWLEYTFTIPSEGGTPSIPFYGGRLTVNYRGGQDDSYGIRITIESRPYLVR